MPNLYRVPDHGRDLLGHFTASHTMPWLRNMFFSNAHNSSLTPKFATFFCLSYFAAQKVGVAPKVSTTRQVFWTNGLTSGSSPITKAKGVRAILPQFFRPFNTEEHTLLARGEETTTPQAARASNSLVLGVHVH